MQVGVWLVCELMGSSVLWLDLGVALTNLATPAVQLQPVCPHHRSVFNDSPPVVLVRRRLVKFCKDSRRLKCFLDFLCFFRVNLPHVLCVGFSLRVELCFWELFFWKIFSCSPVDYFPAYLASKAKFRF